jgi:hypothetical protein
VIEALFQSRIRQAMTKLCVNESNPNDEIWCSGFADQIIFWAEMERKNEHQMTVFIWMDYSAFFYPPISL